MFWKRHDLTFYAKGTSIQGRTYDEKKKSDAIYLFLLFYVVYYYVRPSAC